MFKLIGKRFISMALSVVMLLTMLPMEAVAEQVLTVLEPLSDVPAFESTVNSEEEPAAELVEISVLDPETEPEPEPEEEPVEDLPMDSVADLLLAEPEETETEPETPVEEEEVTDDMSMASIAMMLSDDTAELAGLEIDPFPMETIMAQMDQILINAFDRWILEQYPEMEEEDILAHIKSMPEEIVIDASVELWWTEMDEAKAARDMMLETYSEATEEDFTNLQEAYDAWMHITTMYEVIDLTGTISFYNDYSPYTNVHVSVSNATTETESNGAIVVTAEGSAGAMGCSGSEKTATITVKNTGSVTGTISFDWAANGVNSLNIDGTGYDGNSSGHFTKDVAAGKTITITITTAENANSNQLTLSNFRLVDPSKSFSVTVKYDSNKYSVTGNDEPIPNDSPVEGIPATEGIVLEATSSTGENFVAWVDANGKALSNANPYTLISDNDVELSPVFGNNAFFQVDGILYNSLTAAHTAAKTSTSKIIVLYNNGILPAGTYTIDSGITLLIPFDDAHTVYTTEPESTSYVTPTAYRTLTMADGAKLIINGTMSISGKHKYAETNPYGCSPSGPQGFVRMEGNSNITVNGNLYAYGFITGSGSVTANSTAVVYEIFQVTDFRGGSKTVSMRSGVFPVSQYYIQNIEVPITFHSGAVEKGYVTLYMNSTPYSTKISFIGSGTSGSMFNLSSGTLTKRYDGSTDRLIFDINGDAILANISITISGVSKDSKNFELPLNSNIGVNVNSGTMMVKQTLTLQPGVEITIGKNAKCTIDSGNSIYVYDADVWAGYCGHKDEKFIHAPYVPGRTYTRTEADLKDVIIKIEGEIIATEGGLYTTSGGANICGVEGGKVKIVPGNKTSTTQLRQNAGETDTITVTPAQLKNGDGSYVATANGGNNTYTYTNGKWVCETHTEGGGVADPDATCTEDGKKVYTCTVCGNIREETISKGHTEGDEATCTTAQTCTVCGAELEEALGHKYVGVTTNSTCTENGKTVYTCSRCRDTYTETIPSSGHTEGDEATCTTAQTCTKCGTELTAALGHDYKAEVTAPTCTADGFTTHTCAKCGDTYTSDTVTTMGHSYSSEVTDPTCGAGGYTTHTCSACGDTYKDNYTDATGEHEAKPGISSDISKHPTCKEDGEMTNTCISCGNQYTSVMEAGPDWHQYTSVVTAPTCTAGGYTTHTCSVCSDTYMDSSTDAKGHTEVTVTGKDATCTENGLTAGVQCSVCQTWITEQKKIEAKGHTEGEPVYETIAGPSCEYDGSQYKVVSCTDCGKEVSRETITIPALGHKRAEGDEGEITQQPTCKTEGVRTYTCSVCRTEGCTEKIEIDPEAHNYEAVVTAPTCTADGYTTHTCSRCNDTYTDSKVDAKGHDYKAEVTAPTYDAQGYTTHTCSGCGDTYTDSYVEPLPKLVIRNSSASMEYNKGIAVEEQENLNARIVEALGVTYKNEELDIDKVTIELGDDFGEGEDPENIRITYEGVSIDAQITLNETRLEPVMPKNIVVIYSDEAKIGASELKAEIAKAMSSAVDVKYITVNKDEIPVPANKDHKEAASASIAVQVSVASNPITLAGEGTVNIQIVNPVYPVAWGWNEDAAGVTDIEVYGRNQNGEDVELNNNQVGGFDSYAIYVSVTNADSEKYVLTGLSISGGNIAEATDLTNSIISSNGKYIVPVSRELLNETDAPNSEADKYFIQVSAKREYSVTFNKNGETVAFNPSVKDQKVLAGEKATDPAADKEIQHFKSVSGEEHRYAFKFWSTNKDAVDEEEAYNFNTPVTGDLVLYAIWGIDVNKNFVADEYEEVTVNITGDGAGTVTIYDQDDKALPASAVTENAYVFDSKLEDASYTIAVKPANSNIEQNKPEIAQGYYVKSVTVDGTAQNLSAGEFANTIWTGDVAIADEMVIAAEFCKLMVTAKETAIQIDGTNDETIYAGYQSEMTPENFCNDANTSLVEVESDFVLEIKTEAEDGTVVWKNAGSLNKGDSALRVEDKEVRLVWTPADTNLYPAIESAPVYARISGDTVYTILFMNGTVEYYRQYINVTDENDPEDEDADKIVKLDDLSEIDSVLGTTNDKIVFAGWQNTDPNSGVKPGTQVVEGTGNVTFQAIWANDVNNNDKDDDLETATITVEDYDDETGLVVLSYKGSGKVVITDNDDGTYTVVYDSRTEVADGNQITVTAEPIATEATEVENYLESLIVDSQTVASGDVIEVENDDSYQVNAEFATVSIVVAETGEIYIDPRDEHKMDGLKDKVLEAAFGDAFEAEDSDAYTVYVQDGKNQISLEVDEAAGEINLGSETFIVEKNESGIVPAVQDSIELLVKDARPILTIRMNDVSVEEKAEPADITAYVKNAAAISVTADHPQTTATETVDKSELIDSIVITLDSGYQWPEAADNAQAVEYSFTAHLNDAAGNYQPVQDITAKLTVKNTTPFYTVDYKNGEVTVKSDRVAEGMDIPVLADPERTYYTFAGWKYAGEGDTPETVTKDITFIALWRPVTDSNQNNTADQEEKYTVIYRDGYTATTDNADADIVDRIEDVAWGDATPACDADDETEGNQNPKREGWHFTGWTPDVAETIAAPASGNIITYTAQWVPDANGNKVDDNTETITLTVSGKGTVSIPGIVPVPDTANQYVYDSTKESAVHTITATPDTATEGKGYYVERAVAKKNGAVVTDLTVDPDTDDDKAVFADTVLTNSVALENGMQIEVVFGALTVTGKGAVRVDVNGYAAGILEEYKRVLNNTELFLENGPEGINGTYTAKIAFNNNTEWLSADELDAEKHESILSASPNGNGLARLVRLVWSPENSARYPEITNSVYVGIYDCRPRVTVTIEPQALKFADWPDDEAARQALVEQALCNIDAAAIVLQEGAELPEGAEIPVVYDIFGLPTTLDDGETRTCSYKAEIPDNVYVVPDSSEVADLTIKDFEDVNGNGKDDDDETITVKLADDSASGTVTVAAVAEADANKVQKIAENTYVFDIDNPKIVITARPVVTNGFSDTYVASIKANEEPIEFAQFANDYSYSYTHSAEDGDIITVSFAAAEMDFIENAQPMDYYPGKIMADGEAIEASDLYQHFVDSPEYANGDTVELQYKAREAMQITIGLENVTVGKLPRAKFKEIYGSTEITIQLPEVWMPFNAKIAESISPKQAVKYHLTAENIIAAAGAEDPKAALDAIVADIAEDLANYGMHAFGCNAQAAATIAEENAVTEDVKITYTSSEMKIEEIGKFELVDSREVSVIEANNVDVVYNSFTKESLWKEISATVKDASGNPIDGAVVTCADLAVLENVDASKCQITLKFAGNDQYKPAEKTVVVDIDPGELCLNVVDGQTVASIEDADLTAKYYATNLEEGLREGYLIEDKEQIARLNEGLIQIFVDLDDIDTKNADAEASVKVVVPEWMPVSRISELMELLTDTYPVLDEVLKAVKSINQYGVGIEVTKDLPTDAGAYLYGALTSSRNYDPAVDMGYLLVTGDAKELTFDFEKTGGVFTEEMLKHMSYGASKAGLSEIENAALVQTVFFSCDNTKVFLATDPADLALDKAYTQIAFTTGGEDDGEYYAAPIARSFEMIDETVDVEIVDPEGSKFLRLFDNAPQAMEAQLAEGAKTENLELTYAGLELDTDKVGPTAEAPTAAGVYEATALYIEETNGKTTAIGIDVQPFAVIPAPSIVEVGDETLEEKDLPEGGFDVRELVKAQSTVKSYGVPDTTVIAAGVAFDGELTLKNATGTVYVDLPEWLGKLLADYVPGMFDDPTVNVKTFLDKIDALVAQYGDVLKQIDIRGIDVVAMLNEITATLREIVNTNVAVKVTYNNSLKLSDFGAYAVVGVVTDPNHLPFVEAGVVMITPELVDVKLAKQNVVATVDGQPHGVEVVLPEGATGELKVTYTGLQTNLSTYSSTAAPSHAGAYTAVAVYTEKDENNEITAAGMAVGAVAILPTTSSVDVENQLIPLTDDFSGYAVREMVKAASKMKDVVPNTTVITANVPLNKELTLENAYEAHLDVPAWLDYMIKKYLPANDGQISTDGFIAILKQLNDEYGSLLAGMVSSSLDVKAVIDQVIDTLDTLPGNITLKLCDNCTIKDSGAYIVVGIVTDSEHIPSVDYGALVIAPEIVDIDFVEPTIKELGGLEVNQYVRTYNGEPQPVEITAKRTVESDKPINPENLKLMYIGLESTPEPGFYRETAPDQTGAYMLLAYYYEADDAGNIQAIGMNMGSMIIKPATASIDVATNYFNNGVETDALVTVKNEKGEVDSTIAKTIITAGVSLKAGTVADAFKQIETGMADLETGKIPDLTGLLKHVGSVNIDMPAWLKDALAEMGFDGDVTVLTLKNAVQPLREAYQSAKAKVGDNLDDLVQEVVNRLGGMVEMDTASLDALKPILEQAEENAIAAMDMLVNLLDQFDPMLKVTTTRNFKLEQTGIYLIAGAVTDSDYMPAVDVGVAVVAPEIVSVQIDETINSFTYDAKEKILPVTVGREQYDAANLQMFYMGVASNGKLYASRTAPKNAGIYMEVAVYEEADGETVTAFGMDKGMMTIKPTTTEIKVNGILKNVEGGIYYPEKAVNLKDIDVVTAAADTETEKVGKTVISAGVSLSVENLQDALGGTDENGEQKTGDVNTAIHQLVNDENIRAKVKQLISDMIDGKDVYLKTWATDLVTEITADLKIEDLLPLLKYVDSVNVTTPDWLYDLLKLVIGSDSAVKIETIEKALDDTVAILKSFDQFKTELEKKEEIQKILNLAKSVDSVNAIYVKAEELYNQFNTEIQPLVEMVDLVQDALDQFDEGLTVDFYSESAPLNNKGLYVVAGIVTDPNYMPVLDYDAVVLLPEVAMDLTVEAPETVTYDGLPHAAVVDPAAKADIAKLIYVGVNTHGKLVMQEEAPVEPGVYAAVAVHMLLNGNHVVEKVSVGADVMVIKPLEANVEVKGIMDALEGNLELSMAGLSGVVNGVMEGIYEQGEAGTPVDTRNDLVTATPMSGEAVDGEVDTTVITAGIALNSGSLNMAKGDMNEAIGLVKSVLLGILGSGEMPDTSDLMSQLMGYIDYVNMVNVDLPVWVREVLKAYGLDLEVNGDVHIQTLKNALLRIEDIYDAVQNSEGGTISEIVDAVEKVRPGTVEAVMGKLNGFVPGAFDALHAVLDLLNQDLIITTEADYTAEDAGAYIVAAAVTDPYYLPGIDLEALKTDASGYLVDAVMGMLPEGLSGLMGMLPISIAEPIATDATAAALTGVGFDAIVVVPELVKLEVADASRTYGVDNNKVDLDVQVTIDDETESVSRDFSNPLDDLTMFYVGVSLDGDVRYSAEVPTDAGVYLGIALYTDGEEIKDANGNVIGYEVDRMGFGAGVLDIWASNEVEVKLDGEKEYDSEGNFIGYRVERIYTGEEHAPIADVVSKLDANATGAKEFAITGVKVNETTVNVMVPAHAQKTFINLVDTVVELRGYVDSLVELVTKALPGYANAVTGAIAILPTADKLAELKTLLNNGTVDITEYVGNPTDPTKPDSESKLGMILGFTSAMPGMLEDLGPSALQLVMDKVAGVSALNESELAQYILDMVYESDETAVYSGLSKSAIHTINNKLYFVDRMLTNLYQYLLQMKDEGVTTITINGSNPIEVGEYDAFALGYLNSNYEMADVGTTTITVQNPATGKDMTVTRYVAGAEGTLVIKRSVTVKVEDLTRTYDGVAVTADDVVYTVTANDNNEQITEDDVTVTFKDASNNAVKAPVDAGEYTIHVKLNNPSYDGTIEAKAKLTISKKAVTVTADDKTMVYGGNEPALTATVTDENDEAYSLKNVTVTAVREAGEDADEYVITPVLEGEGLKNYEVTAVPGTFTINKKAVTVTAVDNGKTYGGAEPALTVEVTDENDEAYSLKNVTVTAEREAGENADEYVITPVLEGEGLKNYEVTLETGTFTINKKAVTVTADNKTMVYGGNKPALTATVEGAVDGTPVNYTLTRVAGEAAGTYAITVELGENPNYDVTPVPGTFTIARKPVTVRAIDQNPIYSGAQPEINSSWYEIKDEAGTVLTDVEATISFDNNATPVDAGTYAFNVSPSENYEILKGSDTTGMLTIQKRAIVIKVYNQEKVYGDALDLKYITEGEPLEGDELVINWFCPADETTPVGSTVIFYNGAHVEEADGKISSNYDVSADPTANYATLTITPAPLTVVVDDAEKTYGEKDPAFAGTVSGLKLNQTAEDAKVVYSLTKAVTDAGVYEKVITAATSNANYKIGKVEEGTLTIKRATATVTADDKTKEYDGKTAELTAKVTGLVGKDTVKYSLECTGVNVGEHDITASGDAVQGNYNVEFENGTLTITPKAVTVTAVNNSKTYGDPEEELTATVEGAVENGDAVNYTVSRAPGEAAGDYAITVTPGDNPNYTVTAVPGTFTITKAKATVTANSLTVAYGEAVPELSATVTGAKNGEQLNYTLSRELGSEIGEYEIIVNLGENPNYDVTAVNGKLTITKPAITDLYVNIQNTEKVYGKDDAFTFTVADEDGKAVELKDAKVEVTRAAGSDVGEYAFTVKVTGEGAGDYRIAGFSPSVFTITHATATVTADNKSKEYDGKAAELTATVSGLVGKDTVKYSLECTGVNAGEHTITASGAAVQGNYNVVFVNGKLTITRATATVTADNKSKEYDGKAAELTATVSGLVGKDTVKYSLECTGVNAGEHTITASGAAVQGNYNVVFVNGTLTISKKAATVIVDDKTKIYGDADPALTAVVNGTVGKDTINYTLERAAGADVGVYAITAKLGSNPNYNVTVKNGELTITPATAYILPTGELNGSFVKNYGEEDPALTAIAFDSRDKDKKDITGTIQYTITREPGKDVGDYKLIFNFEEEQGNYIVVELTKAFYLGIKPAELTVEVNDASKVYGEADPAFTAKVTGLVNGETEADATIVYSRTEEAEGKEDVGTYAGAITAALLNEEGNYVITEVINGDLVIKPMDVTVTVSDAAMVYGGDAPVPMAAVKDAKGNAVTGLDISFKAYKVENGAVSDQEIAIADLANADAGSYVIKAVLDNSNYNVVSYKNGELTIAPKTIYIDINDEPITIIEGEAMPEDIAYTLSDENGAITGDALAALIEDIKPVFSALDGDEAIKVEEAKTGEYVITADTANGNYMLVVSTEGVLVIEEDFTGVQFDKVSLSLNLESEVHINLDFTLKGLSKDVAPESILDRLSLLIWNDGNQPATDAESTMAAKPDTITTRASYNKETGMYRIRTDGIAAKNMADILYMKLCIDQLNNNYVYSMRYKFSPKIYCDYVMTSNSYGKDLKDLCAALMNYGAAAQEYFHKKNGYQYAKLMNADSIYANYTIEDYAASMIDALAGLDSSKHGEFVYNGKFTSWRHYLSLEGAITLNFELLHKGEASDAGIYVWNESTYLNAKTLTKENATKIAGKNASEGFFVGAFAGNAAKQIGDTVYVCAYAVIDGVTYYSGVFQDSIEQFAAQIATGEEFDAEFKHVSEDLVVYGEYARRYFKYA